MDMSQDNWIDALVCERPGALTLERRPPPGRGGDEVLVRPRRVGICGTDYHIYEGKHPFLEYPRVMGHELAIEVLEVPDGSRFRAGDLCVVNPYVSCGQCIACRNGKPNCCVRIAVLGVHRDGGMATLLSLPERNLIPSGGLSIDACATVEFLAIGAHAVRRGDVSSRDRLLVIGAGPIGIGVALMASLSGAQVSIMDIDASRLEAARSIVDVTTIAANEGAPEAVASRTSGEGFDIVFDATGNSLSIERGFDFVAHGGRYVLVSVVKGSLHFEDPDFHRREMTLFASRNATAVDFERVMAAIGEGKVPVDRLITHRTTLANAARDLPAWASNRQHLIKAIIEIGD
jgi:2-desacetyl-2-hydroxyethyl bacteriochlorophyllide A dehydrogenase